MMRAFRLSLYFVLGLFLGGYSVFSHAFKAPVTPGAGITGSTGIGFKTDGYQAFTNGKTMGTLNGSVSGQAFSFTAAFPLASTAADILLGSIRSTPLGFVGSVAITTWLASSGISIDNGALVKANNTPVESLGTYWVGNYNDGQFSGPDAACTANIAHDRYAYAVSSSFVQWSSTTSGRCMGTITGYPGINGTWDYGAVTSTGACRDGYIASQGACIRPYSPTAATEEDLAALKSGAVPDGAATEATQKGVKLPLAKPEIETTPKVIPIGDPVTDPKTGIRTRDTIKVTPQPSNPSEVEVTPYKQPVAEDGTPATDPTTGDPEKPAEETDHCKLNPDTIGCSKWGDPEDADLETDTKNATINPDSGWGAATASCPADLNHTLKTGQTVGFKWKPLCDGATMFRPVVIGMAWLTATLIFMGIARKGQA